MSDFLNLINGRAAFTRAAGTAPGWHRLGGETPADADIPTWQVNAGMDYLVLSAPVEFTDSNGVVHGFPGKRAFFRSDNFAPLAINSDRYKVVQPREVLEFFRDLTEAAGYTMDTAGVLHDGQKYWALAKTHNSVTLGGDSLEAYLMLATSCDGSMSTVGKFTSIRVVCDNTLNLALKSAGNSVSVRHSTEFDADKAKLDLGIGDTWDRFVGRAESMMSTGIDDKQAAQTIFELLGDPSKPMTKKDQPKAVERVFDLYRGGAKGSDLPGSRGTVWGLLNAVTEYVDHHSRARSEENRVNSAWFGAGETLKDKAAEQCVELVQEYARVA